MSPSRRSGLEASLDRCVELLDSGAEVRFPVLLEGARAAFSIREAREALYQDPPDQDVRRAVWREAVLRCGGCRGVETGVSAADWKAVVTWLAIPGLRRVVRRVAECFGADRDDVEAEAVLAVLSALETVDPESPSVGGDLLRFSRSRAWAYGRKFSRELSCGDLANVAADRGDPGLSARERAEGTGIPQAPQGLVHSGTVVPKRPSARFRQRVEGERIGSIAERLGLREIVLGRLTEDHGRLIARLVLRSEDRHR